VPKTSLNYPKVCKRIDNTFYIDFKLNDKRYRLFNGNKIGSNLNPNTFPLNERRKQAQNLAKEVYNYLVANNYSFVKYTPQSNLELFDSLIAKKLSEPMSNSYLRTLKSLANIIREELVVKGMITSSFIDSVSLKYNNQTSYNTTRRHINVLVNYLNSNGYAIEKSKLKTKKQVEVLHKPIQNIEELLNEIKMFKHNLYLCCLLTYGCLLRPHQEVRLLKWKDFSNDLTTISLSGNRNKSQRNRIVPVPKYIREILIRGNDEVNIFSGVEKPFNESYFKTLWKRFKETNKGVEHQVTIYSFRHTGAINVYKKSNSIQLLKEVMGHSDIKVSLTYLRGLEVPTIREEDMPMISKHIRP
jgi:integrase